MLIEGMLEHTSSSHGLLSTFWKKIWSLKVAPKIIFFMWKLIRDCLPTQENLCKRKVIQDYRCLICSLEDESTGHAFAGSEWVKQVKFGACFGLHVPPLEAISNFPLWLQGMLIDFLGLDVQCFFSS